ncbi:unnamed protein product [Nippostrongylus brasiliensis]|uniref:Uncharacterized protein n=1 Tax=Nippostrongylus brasiliensis TaxID=27835 RepID=A0A0N4XJP4_NIPBR|nr:unnamed protein product [Nippostrongylus brasiliensis]
MQVRLRYLHKSWRKVKSDVLTSWLRRYRRCVTKLKKYLKDESHMEQERRKSHAKLQPLPGMKADAHETPTDYGGQKYHDM